ncbi:MAG: phosphotransferase family protein [Armatimonadota bacterium]
MDVIRRDQALVIVERLLGKAPDRLEPFRPDEGGDDSHAFRLSSGGQALLLKIKKRAGTPIGIYFHRRIRDAGIPVPALIAFDGGAGPLGEACAIWEWVEGVPAAWGEGQSCPYDEAELGELLRRIHDLPFDGDFGFLGDNLSRRTFSYAPDLAPVSPTWTGIFHCDRAAQRYLAMGYLNEWEASILAELPERLDGVLRDVPCRLLHGSEPMHHGNCLVGPRTRRISAVLDYVESMAGDPRWELAWFDYYFAQFPYADEPFNLQRFRDAYGDDYCADDPVARFYLAAILVFEKLLYFRQGEPRFQWAIEKLKTILSEFNSL